MEKFPCPQIGFKINVQVSERRRQHFKIQHTVKPQPLQIFQDLLQVKITPKTEGKVKINVLRTIGKMDHLDLRTQHTKKIYPVLSSEMSMGNVHTDPLKPIPQLSHQPSMKLSETINAITSDVFQNQGNPHSSQVLNVEMKRFRHGIVLGGMKDCILEMKHLSVSLNLTQHGLNFFLRSQRRKIVSAVTQIRKVEPKSHATTTPQRPLRVIEHIHRHLGKRNTGTSHYTENE